MTAAQITGLIVVVTGLVTAVTALIHSIRTRRQIGGGQPPGSAGQPPA